MDKIFDLSDGLGENTDSAEFAEAGGVEYDPSEFEFMNAAVRSVLDDESRYSPDVFSRITSDSRFCEAVLSYARRLIRVHTPFVWLALLNSAISGNTTAIRLYFDIFGRDIGENRGGNQGEDDGFNPAALEIMGLRCELFGGGKADGGEGTDSFGG
ncbi:MAG: hypothetical protein ACI4XJ_05480 [Eubacteriales bacterium]